MRNRGGKRVKIEETEINSNIKIDKLFSIPFSLIISREWDINYLLISSSDREIIEGFGYPTERGGVLCYDIKSNKAREIMTNTALLIDKETNFYIAYSNVKNVRSYFNAKRILKKINEIINQDEEEKNIKIELEIAIKRIEAQISTERKVQ